MEAKEAIAQLREWSADPLKHMRAGRLGPKSYFERSDVVCDYAEQLEAENERLKQSLKARLSDHINGTPCAEIRWLHEKGDLEARLASQERALGMAKEALRSVPMPSEMALGMEDKQAFQRFNNWWAHERAKALIEAKLIGGVV